MKLLILLIALYYGFKLTTFIIKKLIVNYKLKKVTKMYHYIEYEIYGKKFTTRENGALNNTLGTALLCYIEQSKGKILYHYYGTIDQVDNYIDYNFEANRNNIKDF